MLENFQKAIKAASAGANLYDTHTRFHALKNRIVKCSKSLSLSVSLKYLSTKINMLKISFALARHLCSSCKQINKLKVWKLFTLVYYCKQIFVGLS